MKYRAIGENHLYRKAYAKGRKAVTRTVVVYVLRDLHAKRLQREHPQKKRINRIGLTVTKKIGGAVVRSRAKRVLREAYRLTDSQYGVRTGYLIVLVARDATPNAKSGTVQRDMYKVLLSLDMLDSPEGVKAASSGKSITAE